jgi:hypothetical protein
MTSLHVYLENGFDHDRVTVEAAGQARDETDVTTRYQVGLARALELTVATSEPTLVRVSVPDRGLTGEATVDAAITPHVRVDLTGAGLTVEASSGPPMFA